MRLCIASSLCALFASPFFADAEQLMVRDCVGQVRWVEEIDSAEVAPLAVGAVQADVISEARLIRERDGTVIHGNPTAAGISFDGVSAGDWRLCATPATSQFSSFQFAPGEKDSLPSIRTAALTVTGVGTGIALMALGSGNSGGDATGPLAPGPQPLVGSVSDVVVGADSSATASVSAAAETASGRSSKRGLDCFIDDEVSPISPLS